MKKKDVKKILSEYDPKVKSVVNKVLAIEREYEYMKNLSSPALREINKKIIKVIIEETKQ